ncbi:MAG: diguanylate cyclase [Clostridiales Family XIII bacterium]|jgi:diguanylate cyclase (GGDEF)-like protein|nr:diguanylate cyclase [Clostridiales Family XIII bacterium]
MIEDQTAVSAENNKEVSDAADAMFNYLRDVIYHPQDASLDLSVLPSEMQEFGEALLFFCGMVMDAKTYAINISKGQLDAVPPARDNEFSAPLKDLLASLKHLTWQAKQVALGDYQQKVDFMGEFSVAFNDMTEQLKQRREALANEADEVRKQALYLERSNILFKSIMGNISDLIIVIDRMHGDRLFTNHPPKNVLASETFEDQLYSVLLEYAQNIEAGEEASTDSFTLISDTGLQHFSVILYSIRWDGHDAVACVLEDITEEKERMDELENAAYRDIMTGAYNRHYGMKVFDEWAEAKEKFSVIFVDMDMLKYVNDVFGHSEGDTYINSVNALLGGISPNAIVSRLGGDEFMVLAKEEDVAADSVSEHLEKLRAELVASAPKDENGKDIYPRSISFGVVLVDETNELPPADLLSMADERMYEYKKAHKKERLN